jgi:hypothetical protein
MLAELVEHFLGLEGRQDRLDQHRAAHAAVRHAERRLGVREDVVPQARLEVALHLRQVEVRTAAPREQLLGVVEEIEPEIDEPAGDGTAVEPACASRAGASRAAGRAGLPTWSFSR